MKRSAIVTGLTFLSLIVLLLRYQPAEAQTRRSLLKTGVGFELMLAPPNNPMTEGIQIGFMGRISYPLTPDVSFAGGLGLSSYLFQGRRNALYALMPELSVIVTIPQGSWLPYIKGGIGAYQPLSGGGRWDSGPTLHTGIGWVRPLRGSSYFIEINPMLIVGRDRTVLTLPVRTGVIF